MKRNEYKVYFREYGAYRVYLGESMQWLNLENDAGFYNEHRITFEDLNEAHPRVLYEFEVGTTFEFTCSNEHVDINRTLVQENKEIVIEIHPEDVDIPYSTSPPYLLSAAKPSGRRVPLCKGEFRIKK